MKVMRISVHDLYALEEHAGVKVINHTNMTGGGVSKKTTRYYMTTIGNYYSNRVWFSHLIGYLCGACYVAIKEKGAPPLSPHLVKVTKEAQRRDAAYYEQGRNQAIQELSRG